MANSHASKIKRADELYSALLNKRAGCQIQHEGCNVVGIEPHHYIHRDNMQLRWNPDNGIWTCRSCHMWAHAHPKAFEDWFKLYHPIQYAFLMREKNKLNTDLGSTLEFIIQDLQQKLKNYE